MLPMPALLKTKGSCVSFNEAFFTKLLEFKCSKTCFLSEHLQFKP